MTALLKSINELFYLFILYYCDNFACEDCTQGDLYNKYTYYIQIHNHGLLIRWFLKVSIEVIPLMWLGKLFHRLQARGPKESLYKYQFLQTELVHCLHQILSLW